MFEFAAPLVFLALPAPLIVWLVVPAYKQRASALRVPFFRDLINAAGAEAHDGAVTAGHTSAFLIFQSLIWCLLVCALARPQWVGNPIERNEAARDIMLAIDLSESMDTKDFPLSDSQQSTRLAAVQEVVKQFVADRDSDRIGLIVFGDKAYLQLPFTRDVRTADELVSLMDVGMAGPRTALGDAIGVAMHAFESSEVESKILILLTDGNDTASQMTPLNAAGVARSDGVEIHTIGIGDTEATGEDRVDFAVLAQIAERTGGLFYTATDQSDLAAVYQQIDEATAVEARVLSFRPKFSLVVWPAAACFMILCAMLVVSSVTQLSANTEQ
ncbi:MAG: VWA domain-containing protein [Pseudomonadota bacterium]